MADKTYENILIEREGGITFLWLNRPDKRNAMSPGLHADMDDALGWLATDKQTKVLVLGGKGEAWCAGQDLRLYFRGTQDNPEARYKANNDSHSWRWERLSQFPKPTIAMVHGFAFGGAFTQLCACDFAIAAEDATFGLSEVNWGIIPGGLVSWNLTDMLLPRHAMYYAVTGDTFDGKRAVEIGLVNFAVPKAKLREETDQARREADRSSIRTSCATPRKRSARCARWTTSRRATTSSRSRTRCRRTTRRSASSTA